MSDSKGEYSEASRKYIVNDVINSITDRERYNRSKDREAKYNENWKANSVNLNDIVEKFAPNGRTYNDGVKFVFEGDKYSVVADMPSGYCRIRENSTDKYLKLDGTYGKDKDTHFKIKRREEM